MKGRLKKFAFNNNFFFYKDFDIYRILNSDVAEV